MGLFTWTFSHRCLLRQHRRNSSSVMGLSDFLRNPSRIASCVAVEEASWLSSLSLMG